MRKIEYQSTAKMEKVKEQISGMEQTRRELLSRSIRAAAAETESMDVTLVCKDGLRVQTHASLMAALSKRMGKLFTTLTTFPVVVIIPDLTKGVVEKLLKLYSREWEEAEVNLEVIEAAQLLGLPLPLARQCKEANSTQKKNEQTIKQMQSEWKASKPTMPSMLVRVKKEKKDGVAPDANSDSENSDFESEKYIESAIQEKAGIDKNTNESNGPERTEASLECDQCGTSFDEKEGLKIHIGEVHMEQQLLTEQFLTFPGGAHSPTCVGCGEECSSDYEKKEHILLSHPWPSLKAQVEEIVDKFAKNETSHEELRMELVAHIESLASVPDNFIECEVCGTAFEKSEEVRIHIGEVHMDEDLLCELFKVFPGNATKCKECGDECGSEYERKEHILLQHPWPLLKAMAGTKESQNSEKETNSCHKEDAIKKDKKEEDGLEKVENKDIDTKKEEETKQSKALEMNEEKWFQYSSNYSCNYCDKKFSEPVESKKHLEKAHNIKKNHSEHIAHAGKKYSCKICLSRVDHNLKAIKQHLKRVHNNLDVNAYEAQYEKAPEVQLEEKDLLGEVLDDTLNELCEPAKRVASFLEKIKESKKRKLSGDSHQNSKVLKPLDENMELESQIEFSDSSDDEEK